MSVSARKSRFPIFLVVGLLLLVVIWCGYWFFAFAKIQEAWEKQKIKLSAQGIKLSCQEERWAGFPFRFEWHCRQFSVHNLEKMSQIEIGQVMAFAQAYNPFHVNILPEADITVQNPSLKDLFHQPKLVLSHNKARIAITYDLAGQWQLSSDFPQAAIAPYFKAHMLRVFMRNQDGNIEVASEADRVLLENLLPHTLPLTHLALEATVPENYLTQKSGLEVMARTGQPVTLGKFQITSEQAILDVAGHVFLDTAFKLNGKMSLAGNNGELLIGQIRSLLKLAEGDIATLQSMLAMAGVGGPNPFKLEFTLDKGNLRWGGLKLFKIPALKN